MRSSGETGQGRRPAGSRPTDTLRGRGARVAALTLLAPALLMLFACAATPTQNGGAANVAAPSPQAAATPKATPQRAASQEGDITVTPITHASFQLEHGGKVIHVDPTSAGDYSASKQADLILVVID